MLCKNCGNEIPEGAPCPNCQDCPPEPAPLIDATTEQPTQSSPSPSTCTQKKPDTATLVKKYVRGRRLLAFLLLCTVLTYAAMFYILYKTDGTSLFVVLKRYLILFCPPLILALFGFLYVYSAPLGFTPQKDVKKPLTAMGLVFLCSFSSCSLAGGVFFAFYLKFIFDALCFILLIQTMKRKQKLCQIFFNCRTPSAETPCVDFETHDPEAHRILQRYDASKPSFLAKEKYMKARELTGTEPKKIPDFFFWVKAKAIPSLLFALALIASVVLSCILPAKLANPFRKENYTAIALYSDRNYVEDVLGKPFISPANEGAWQSENVYTYYDKNYDELLSELIEYQIELETLMLSGNEQDQQKIATLSEKINDLQAEMLSTSYDRMEITFASSRVIEVKVEKDICELLPSAAKEMRSVKVSILENEEYEGSPYYYTATFTDGSYIRAYLPTTSIPAQMLLGVAGEYNLTWADSWTTYQCTYVL